MALYVYYEMYMYINKRPPLPAAATDSWLSFSTIFRHNNENDVYKTYKMRYKILYKMCLCTNTSYTRYIGMRMRDCRKLYV